MLKADQDDAVTAARVSTVLHDSRRVSATPSTASVLSDIVDNWLPSFRDTQFQPEDEIQMGTESWRMTPDDRRSFHSINMGGEMADRGARLTWEDLCVTVPDRGGGSCSNLCRAILESSTGYAEPGRILALMGPSGCGKSTLLDTLAGRLSSTARLSGQILVNGKRQTLAFGNSAYVTQEDVLLTTLTVREVVYYAAQLQLPESMPKVNKLQRADDTIREMGLQDAANTRIGGGPRSRGLSGGQKRRVSICLEILTRPRLLFLDEPTSGLDSAASFNVMKRIAALARRHGQTVVLSVHQPSNEVFELLDDLYLLTQGKTVYFGPTSQASEFFSLNGFPCPSLMNPPDHYLKTINRNFEQGVEEERHSDPPKLSITEGINILVSSYQSSSYKSEVDRRLAKISGEEGQKLEKESQASFLTQCILLTQRSMINMFRDAGYYWLRFLIYIGMAICIGTLFYNLDLSYPAIQERYAVIFFVSSFLTFMTVGGFPSFVEDLKVFGGERLNGHYGAAAFVISHTFSSIPFLFVTSLIPAIISYYMVGLRSSFSNFFYFAVCLFVLLLLVESLMMLVAGIVDNFLLGIITGSGIQGFMILSGGFFQLPHYLPKVIWKYPVHYMAFHKYGNQGFAKNEFLGLKFTGPVKGSTITGLEVVRDMYQIEIGYSKWVDLAVLIGMVLVYRILFFGLIKFKERAPVVRFSKPTKAMHIMAQLGITSR